MTGPDGLPPLDPEATQRLSMRLLAGLMMADSEPLVLLRQRLGRPDADAWLQAIRQDGPTGDPTGDLVAEALARAKRLVDGVPDALQDADPVLLEEVWALLCELAPASAELAISALAVLPEALSTTTPSSTDRAGQYDLLDLIGEGSFGSVYRARHREHRGIVALKLLRRLPDDSSAVARFRREARLCARLRHPGIVRILDCGVTRRAGQLIWFTAYELIDGRPFLAAARGSDRTTLLDLAIQLGEAVAHAHAQRILHRDIKSENVLVDAAMRAHLLDFGAARTMDGSESALTLPTEIIGSLTYMSAEQAAGRTVDQRADVFAIGCLMFSALAGHGPRNLTGLDAAAAVRRVMHDPVPSLADVFPGAGDQLVAVVDKALAHAPRDRYQDVRELVDDLRRLQAGQPVSARPPTSRQLYLAFLRRHRRLAGVLAASALAALVTIASLFLAWRTSENAVATTMAAERRATAAAESSQDTMQKFARAMGQMIESVPTSGPRYEEPVRLIDETLQGVQATHGLPRDARTAATLADLHELAGDLALHGGRVDESRSHRERALALRSRLANSSPRAAILEARARVKLGDLAPTPAVAAEAYLEAHATFVAALATAERWWAADEVGWSFERLSVLDWQRRRRSAAAAMASARIDLAEGLVVAGRAGAAHQLASALAHFVAFALEAPAAMGVDARQLRLRAEQGATAAIFACEENPKRLGHLELAAKMHNYLATVCKQEGDLAAAVVAQMRSVELLKARLRADPFSPAAFELAVWGCSDLALLQQAAGDHSGEADAWRLAAELAERAVELRLPPGKGGAWHGPTFRARERRVRGGVSTAAAK